MLNIERPKNVLSQNQFCIDKKIQMVAHLWSSEFDRLQRAPAALFCRSLDVLLFIQELASAT